MTHTEYMLKLAAERGRQLTPAEVVDAARPEDSPIHGWFQWDDTLAAQAYRLVQARELLRVCVTIEPAISQEPIHVFVSLKSDRHPDGGYRVLTDVLSDAELRDQLLQEAFDDLSAACRRYQMFNELAGVFSAVEQARVAFLASKKKKHER